MFFILFLLIDQLDPHFRKCFSDRCFAAAFKYIFTDNLCFSCHSITSFYMNSLCKNACTLCEKRKIVRESCFYRDAAEQKARTTYDNLLRLVKDPEVADPLRFLRAREVVHFQRFGEALRITQEHLDSRNFYIMNPEFDTGIARDQGNCGCEKQS